MVRLCSRYVVATRQYVPQEETELGLMEAVVTKMSRIIAHVGSQSDQGAQILSTIQACSSLPYMNLTCPNPPYPAWWACT